MVKEHEQLYLAKKPGNGGLSNGNGFRHHRPKEKRADAPAPKVLDPAFQQVVLVPVHQFVGVEQYHDGVEVSEQTGAVLQRGLQQLAKRIPCGSAGSAKNGTCL